jgi:di/tricarboxylate transporter
LNIEIVSIAVLVAIFVIATVLPVNMGVLAFAAAFGVGALILGLTPAEIFGGFPADLFVTLVGVTYLFAIAHKNGTVDWLVDRAVALVGGRVAAVPWVMFAVSAVLTGFGALGPAAIAILAPVALRFAVQHRLSPVMMGLMVIHGAQAGGFSPISVYGGIVNGVVAKAGLASDPTALFLSSLLFNLGIAVLVFLLFGGLQSLRRHALAAHVETHLPSAEASISGTGGAPAPLPEPPPAAAQGGLNVERGATLLGLTALCVGALAFEFNVGLVAMTVAALLALISPKTQKGAVGEISWPTVLLISGVITYVAVMQKAGAVDYVGQAISQLDAPLVAALLLCFTGAIVSAFASSTALLGAVIPLAVPFLMTGRIGAVDVVAAISVCTTIVDTSPFSTNGALVVANTPEAQREAVLRTLLIYSAVIALAGPVAAWLVLIVPGLM